MSQSLIAPTFLFRFSAPCLYQGDSWSAGGVELGTKYRMPCFSELDGREPFADVRLAWSERGLTFNLRVTGKKQAPWCRESRPDDSDGLQIWIASRETHNIHRATRFCHRFVFMPIGGGRRLDEPVADQLLIGRARENAHPVRPGLLQAHSEKRVDGYLLRCHIPADAITGYDPGQYQRLGFTYAVVDRELGWQTFSVGPEYPFQDDPSLWGTLELDDKQPRATKKKK